MRDATIVVDPGHGGLDPGAVGKGGLREKTLNLDIAGRMQSLLRPARVFLTRHSDYTVALGYRTAIAFAVGAHMFVSVHHNASPDGPSEHPGTETYYQLKSKASKRLAGLTFEEVRRTLERFPVSWVSQDDAGAKYRMNQDGIDYYFVLRHSKVPAVLVEGAFISNPPEEALLRREDVKNGLSRALTRAIDRYVTTDDPGSGFITKPLPRVSGVRSRTPSRCRDPR
jgi:N-acetylmuramoyl-L-alanine amidase